MRRRWHLLRRVWWLGVVLMVAGCTTVRPDFVPPKAPVLAQWQEADSAAVTQEPAEQMFGRRVSTKGQGGDTLSAKAG